MAIDWDKSLREIQNSKNARFRGLLARIEATIKPSKKRQVVSSAQAREPLEAKQARVLSKLLELAKKKRLDLEK